MSPWALNRLSHAVARGAVFGYPTDTIWGFGCHPLIAASVNRILKIKNRSPTKGLILLSSRIEYCVPYFEAGQERIKSLTEPSVEPTTWLVTASAFCPPWIRGNFDSVAIRITDHPLVQSICDRLHTPIVSTSANRAGCSTARNVVQMHRQFGDQLDCIVGGFGTGSGRPSEIKFLDSGNSVRTAS